MTMAKNTLFTIVENNLVYRNTGRVYSGTYTVKGHTVYGNTGRKIGTVGKPTTAKQKKIIERVQKRLKKKKQFVKFKETETIKIEETQQNKGLSLQDLADIGRSRGPDDKGMYDVYQTELYNLAEILQDAIDSGAITQQEGQSLLNDWLNAKTTEERNNVWNRVRALFDERGFRYL